MKCKLLFFIFLLFFCLQLRAEDTEKDPYIEMVSVEYDYELYNSSSSIYNTGTLTVKLKVAEDISQVQFQYTRPYFSPPDRIFFGARGYIDVDNPSELVVFSRDKVNYGRYFRFGVKDKFENWHYTQTISTYDYITPEDMEIILNNASVEEIDSDNQVNLSFENNILTVDASSDTQVAVYDITGRTLYSGNIFGSTSIPIQSNFIIVRYSTNNQVFTKKFISK